MPFFFYLSVFFYFSVFFFFETVFFVLRSFSTKNIVNMQNAKEKWIRVGDCIEKIYVPISICTCIFPREGRTERRTSGTANAVSWNGSTIF